MNTLIITIKSHTRKFLFPFKTTSTLKVDGSVRTITHAISYGGVTLFSLLLPAQLLHMYNMYHTCITRAIIMNEITDHPVWLTTGWGLGHWLVSPIIRY